MNRRVLVTILLIIGLLGTGSVAYRYIGNSTRYYQAHQPTKMSQPLQFLYPISGNHNEGLNKPMGVFVKGARLYVASAGGRIFVTDREGERYKAWDLSASGSGHAPRSIVVDEDGLGYVSLGQKKRILVIDAEGRTVQTEMFGADAVKNPVGLAYYNGHIYVTDVGDHSVKIFTREGKLVKKFGGPGAGPGRFAYPNGVTVADDGTIYVADSNNSRIQVFDKDYNYIDSLPEPPRSQDRLLLPRSVAIDKLGRIYAVDTLRGLVHVYSPNRKYLFKFGQAGNAGTKLAYPNSIAIDEATGLVFIADRGKNRVSVWAEN